jgi:PAS domain S-box-containing protein
MHSLSSLESYLHLAGIILAAVGIVLAIRLIPLVGKARTWLLLAATLVLLAVDRVIEWLGHSGIWLEADSYPIAKDMLIAGAIGCLCGVVCFIRDIFRERKLAEEKIHRQQELTSQIIETIPMRVLWKDRDLRYLGGNTLLAKDAGLNRPEELIGKTDFDLSWKDQAELYRADDRRVMDADAPKLAYDEPQTTPDGRQIWLRTSKAPLRDADNKVIGMLGIYDDITKSKDLELRLLESEKRFRDIIETTSDWVWQIDAHGHYVYVSPRVRDILGYEPEELLGKTPFDFMPAEEGMHLAELGKNAWEKQEGFSFIENTIIHKDGRRIIIETSGVPIVGNDGTLRGYFGCDRDITERKRAEEEIRDLNDGLEIMVQERTKQLLASQDELVRKGKLAVLGQVAGRVGHELRNPLGVMSNAVYFLQTVLSDADEITREYLDIIKDEISISDRIVSDLLDSIRAKPPFPEAVGLGEVIERILQKLTIPDSVSITQDIPEALPALRVDAMQISQVFRNLISNGVEAMPEGGKLEIRAVENRPDGTVVVSIRDNGSGMTPEQQSRLFEPLFTTKARGIGLGLVVVKNLTEANGGTVDVESAAGKGSTFSIVLPAAQ